MIKMANIVLDNDDNAVVEVYRISSEEPIILEILMWDVFSKLHDDAFNCYRIEMICEELLQERNVSSLIKAGPGVGIFVDYDVLTSKDYEELRAINLIRYSLNEKCIKALEDGIDWIDSLEKMNKLNFSLI